MIELYYRFHAWRFRRCIAQIFRLDDVIDKLERQRGDYLSHQDLSPRIRRLYRRRTRLEEKLTRLSR